ncbi:MAG: hypothetical protein NUW21_13915, partial [Elusimicrobia bacterium]|nr:hypothetical protein [Elusimicrobiota bacterium]
MRRALIPAALLLLAACAGPKPCTRTLCVTKLDGTMDLAGWAGGVRATSESPKPPVMSDSTVTMIYGTAEFRNGKTVVTASEGSSFKFTVSTRAVSSIEVSSGTVMVQLS